MTETHNADGTTDTVAFARYNDVGIAVTTKKDADGNVSARPPARCCSRTSTPR